MKALYSLIQSSASTLFKVSATHCRAIKLGAIADIFIANNILNGYAKHRVLHLSHELFDEMPHRDVVSWNTLIAGYVNCGELERSWEVLRSMRRSGLELDGHTFGSILKGISSAGVADPGKQVHSVIVKMGLMANVFSGSALLDMYAKCGRVDDAYAVFRQIPEPNYVSWNALIAAYAQVGDRGMSFWLMDRMEKEGVSIDDGTISPILTLLDESKYNQLTKQVHGKIIKHGLELDNTVHNATITAYSDCGSIDDAIKVFDGAGNARDIVACNSMLTSYVLHNRQDNAFKLFVNMQKQGFEPDEYTYTSVITACGVETLKGSGKSIHGLIIRRGLGESIPVCNALIAMYLSSNSGSLEDAVKIFNIMEPKDGVSWNSILTGYSQIGLSEEALKVFLQMRSLLVEVDDYSFSAVLRSCSESSTLQLGQQVHTLALKLGFDSNEYVGSALIFLYSKCGIIEDAWNFFQMTLRDSTITWNSIIFGYAQYGQGNIALQLFDLMIEKKVKPDHITFVAVLTACSHIGFVEKGISFLRCMESDYGITPRMEHYACAIDIYGRAGRIDDAKALIKAMPFEPDAMVWKTLLGACRNCGDIELATEVASHLLEIEPEEHCTYILLSEMYGRLKRWSEKANITKCMRKMGVKKVPGFSWIEVKNKVHAFNADDHGHPHSEEIYFLLRPLIEETKMPDTVPNLYASMHCFDGVDEYCN